MRVDLVDSARSHFAMEEVDAETTPLYLSLKSMIERSKTKVISDATEGINQKQGTLVWCHAGTPPKLK